MSQEKLNHVAMGLLYDVFGFLTNLEQPLTMGSTKDATPAVHALQDFIEQSGIQMSPPISDWRARCELHSKQPPTFLQQELLELVDTAAMERIQRDNPEGMKLTIGTDVIDVPHAVGSLIHAISLERDEYLRLYKELQELAIWMTGCGYDFSQHAHFEENRELLTLDLSGNDPDDSVEEPVKERRLTPEYQAKADEYAEMAVDHCCSCHINPPCCMCEHEGNPLNLEEIPEAWEPNES